MVHCAASGAPEIEGDGHSPGELALENARRKAVAIAPMFPEEFVLAADTVVVREGRFYGKPTDMRDAFRMLKELSGRRHEVVTGVVVQPPGERAISFSETSSVRMRPLNDADILRYLEAINPLDKAGSYAAQDDEGFLIEAIEGSFTNVVGLPMETLADILARAGFPAPRLPQKEGK